ncbi:CocE/NonD family hydrolase, partial [Streptosporangium sp. NPDC001682]
METLRIGPAPLHPGAEQFMVPMRDGTRLATDVYLPPAPGRHPVVVSRMPYDKASAWMAVDRIAPRYLERGYVFVAQDVRGKFRSEGETMPFVHEVEDSYDTLDWVVGQPWSDGAVAMTGDSYHGYTQWAGVAGGHPAPRVSVTVKSATTCRLCSTRATGGCCICGRSRARGRLLAPPDDDSR